MSWTQQPIFFVDFEGNRRVGILEYGVVGVFGGEITDPRTRLCASAGRIDPAESATHRLAEKDLAGCAPFADEWDYFANLRGEGPLAAHYAGVENALLKNVWPYPPSSPDFARPGSRLVDWGPWIDTARLYAQLYPQIGSGELSVVVKAAGLQNELDRLADLYCPSGRKNYHAALYDALAGALLLVSLAREPQLASLSIMQLLALSTLDGTKRDSLQQGQLFS